MRRSPLALVALASSVLPVGWFAYFAVHYRCDLTRYLRLWRDGTWPAWATLWVSLVAAGGSTIALILLPKAVRLWREGKPLTRGEWIALGAVAVLTALGAVATPASMVDQAARLAALVGRPTDQCRH